MISLRALIQDDQGLLKPARVNLRREGRELLGNYDQPLQLGEPTELKGWGSLDGPAHYVRFDDSWGFGGTYIVPNEELQRVQL